MLEDRQIAIELIDEAVTAGARRFKACAVLEIDVRTLQRWKKALAEPQGLGDRRKAAGEIRAPANKLSQQERDTILKVCNQPQYKSLPPSQIVPRLADDGEYIASESSFYRVLRAADQVHRRGRGNPAAIENEADALGLPVFAPGEQVETVRANFGYVDEGEDEMATSQYRSGVPDNWFVDPVDLGVPGVRRDIDATEENTLAWQTDALCSQTDPEAFFPEKGGSTRDAKRICTSCDVRSECLEYALQNDERFGIWGGLSERERRKLKRRA